MCQLAAVSSMRNARRDSDMLGTRLGAADFFLFVTSRGTYLIS